MAASLFMNAVVFYSKEALSWLTGPVRKVVSKSRFRYPSGLDSGAPGFDLDRVLLQRPLHLSLRGKSPALEVFANEPILHLDAKALLDQRLDRRARP
jgi:hypothetical protein